VEEAPRGRCQGRRSSANRRVVRDSCRPRVAFPWHSVSDPRSMMLEQDDSFGVEIAWAVMPADMSNVSHNSSASQAIPHPPSQLQWYKPHPSDIKCW
jgi:hypothetical protein